jgi:mycothiol synthase
VNSVLAGIARAAEEEDGAPPVDEATWRALRTHPGTVLVTLDDGGFALVEGPRADVVVHPDHRGQGVGRRLATGVTEGGAREAWSHADHPAARRLAEELGWRRERELWVMRRPAGDLPGVPDSDIQITTYTPDWAEELLRVNAAAFAAHPEQGHMDADDLAARMAEPWWDPDDLLLATEGDRLLGFHWTKVHSASLGEVYVVGIDPAGQGRGLGKLLTAVGLHHLADRGVEEILLYVESDNAPAIAVYSGLGFTHAPRDTHVMYRR